MSSSVPPRIDPGILKEISMWNPVKETFSAWLQSFVVIVSTQNPTDDMKTAIMLQRLERGPRYQAQCIVDEFGSGATWDMVVNALKEELEGPTTGDPKTLLDRAVEPQRPRESCRDLWARINSKASELGVTLSAPALVRILLGKVQSQIAEMIVKRGLNESSAIRDVLRVCDDIEQWRRVIAPAAAADPVAGISADLLVGGSASSSSSSSSSGPGVFSLCGSCGKDNHQTADCKGSCRLCGKYGHWARDCWYRGAKGQGSNQYQRDGSRGEFRQGQRERWRQDERRDSFARGGGRGGGGGRGSRRDEPRKGQQHEGRSRRRKRQGKNHRNSGGKDDNKDGDKNKDTPLDLSEDTDLFASTKRPKVYMMENPDGGVCVVMVTLWGHKVPCLLDTGGGVNLMGQLALRHIPKNLQMEQIPSSYQVHGANGQEVALTGVCKTRFCFEGLQRHSQPVIVRCAIAPEFKGGLLLSKQTMQQIGITIELRQPRCQIHFRRWNMTMEELSDEVRNERAWCLSSEHSPLLKILTAWIPSHVLGNGVRTDR